MTAGLNTRSTIWRINTTASDDSVGGAVTTGTAVYYGVQTMFQGDEPLQLLLQQGLETERTFTATVIPGTMDIRERDELEITEPYDNVYHGCRFRIVGVRYAHHNPRDPRNYMLLSLVRSVRAHVSQ